MQITLRAARISAGYSPEEVQKLLNIPPRELDSYEMDSSEIPMVVIVQLQGLYSFSLDNLFLGNESHFSIKR